MRCTQAVLQDAAQKGGHIINISRRRRLASRASRRMRVQGRARSDEQASQIESALQRPRLDVAPGVIQTPILSKSGDIASELYAGPRRMNPFVRRISGTTACAGSVIGEQIREIVGAESWQVAIPGAGGCRHPAGVPASRRKAVRSAISTMRHGVRDGEPWTERRPHLHIRLLIAPHWIQSTSGFALKSFAERGSHGRRGLRAELERSKRKTKLKNRADARSA